VVVHRSPAAAIRTLRAVPARLRLVALPRGVRPGAGRADRLSRRRLAHRGAAAVGADDHFRRGAAGVGVPRTRSVRQLRGRPMKQYLELMRRIRTEGERKQDRTGTGTLPTDATTARSRARWSN